MKDLVLILILILLGGCQEEVFQYNVQSEILSVTDNLSEFSPLLIKDMIVNRDSCLTSYNNGFMAKNYCLESSGNIYAMLSQEDATSYVKVMQNIVEIYDDANNFVRDFMVSMVPTNKCVDNSVEFNWEDCLYYEKGDNFSGYEIIGDPKDGKVCGVWFYDEGELQYGTMLYENDPNLKMKQAFLMKLLSKISLYKFPTIPTRDSYYEVTEEERDEVTEKTIKITYVYVIPEKDIQQDSDNQKAQYLNPSSGSKKDNIDYLQNDYIPVDGNTFFIMPIVSEYSTDTFTGFPIGGYESSPCLAVSLALSYFGKYLTPEYIWETVDTDDSEDFFNIFNDYIDQDDLKFLISKYFNYYKCSTGGIINNISQGRSVIAVCNTGTNHSTYKCVLVVGYTSERELIYLDPVSGFLKSRPNDFLEGYTFVIINNK